MSLRSDRVLRCANSACGNKPYQGEFTVVINEQPIVGSGMPVVLIMCSPCADVLTSESRMNWERQLSEGDGAA